MLFVCFITERVKNKTENPKLCSGELSRFAAPAVIFHGSYFPGPAASCAWEMLCRLGGGEVPCFKDGLRD